MLSEQPAPPGCSESLSQLLRHPGIWRRGQSGVRAQPSGHAALDALLPGGGWPCGTLTEILVEREGLGEMSLVMPALAALTQVGRRVAMIAPPHLPYPPALAAAGLDLAQLVQIDATCADTHWSAEQCLRAGCCAAVLHWMPEADYRRLRRLQLAAESGDALAFVFRPASALQQSSPASLRLLVSYEKTNSYVEILKCRGDLARHHRVLLRNG